MVTINFDAVRRVQFLTIVEYADEDVEDDQRFLRILRIETEAGEFDVDLSAATTEALELIEEDED